MRIKGEKFWNRKVLVKRKDLAILCLNVDYITSKNSRDEIEETSVNVAKAHKIDTHEFRHEYKHFL